MKKLHRIESEHVTRLAPGQLAELLRILLYAEAHAGRVVVHAPQQIYVPDDGEDARWDGEVSTNEYIPNRFCIYQSKAQELSPGQCAEAMLGKDGKVKPAVAEALDRNGCYLFFCGRPYVQLAHGISERVESAHKALVDAGRAVGPENPIRFLDANKIADWANHHAAAVAHVCECCQLPPVGEMRTWSDWSREQILRTSFHSNPKLDSAMDSLRGHLAKPGNIARITGLSGLGKTRLAFEAFRPSDDKANIPRLAVSHSVAYLDMAHDSGDVLALVSAVEASRMSGILVVDNCERSQHLELARIIQREGCQLSLLTLDYVPEFGEAGVLHVPLIPEMMIDIVPKILKDAPEAQGLTDTQINHIATFAHGFPQIATLMAEAGDVLDFERLDQRGWANRILWGRGEQDQGARQALTSIALFTHIGFEDPHRAQKAFVREQLCGPPAPTERDFDGQIRPFLSRRILQKAGAFRMVTPPPLAVALAAEWWESATPEELARLLPLIEACGLIESFCNRVRQLHFSPNATALAAQLCGGDGPLSNAEVLSSGLGSLLFRAFVELNPAAATDCLSRVFGQASLDVLRNVQAGRRNLVWALEKACWNRDQFLQGARILLRLAAAENETWANNATGQFKQLFQLYLSGTQMPAIDRLPVLEEGLANADPAFRRVCIEALGVGLNAAHFSRSGGVEVRGSGLPQEDWVPKTNEDIWGYWERCFAMLAATVREHSPESPAAQTELGRHLRGILHPVLLERLEPEFRSVAEALEGYWPEALESLRLLLSYEAKNYPPASVQRLHQWIAWITPADLASRLKLIVTEAPFEHEQGVDGQFVDLAERRAEELAAEMAERTEELLPYLDHLQEGDQRQGYAFGRRLGALAKTPAGFVNACLDSLRRIPVGKRSVQLLGAFLIGTADRELRRRTLARVASDSQLSDLLVMLTRLGQPSVEEVRRIVDLILTEKVPPESLRHFAYGSVLDHLTPEDVLTLFRPLVAALPAAAAPVFHVVYMYIFRSAERWRLCRSFLRELIVLPDFSLRLHGTMDLHNWEQTCQTLLKETRDEALACELTRQILAAQNSPDLRHSGDSTRRALLGTIMSSYSESCWPLVGSELLSPNHYRLDMLLRGFGFHDHEASILWNLPKESLVAWVRTHPKGTARILSTMTLFYADKSGEYHWHPSTLTLFDEGLDKECTSAVAGNLFSYGSSGSRVPYIDRRLRLLHSLDNNPAPSVREMASELIKAFEADKAREQKTDEEEAAGIF